MFTDSKIRWHEIWRLLREDKIRNKEILGNNTVKGSFIHFLFPIYTCVFLFRVSHYFSRRKWFSLARFFWLLNFFLTGVDMVPSSIIGGGLYIPYPAGVSIHCRAGGNLTVMALAGIGPTWGGGENTSYTLDDIPQLGDRVILSHHSGIYGGVKVGNDVHVSPGCIVSENVSEGTRLVLPSPRLRRI